MKQGPLGLAAAAALIGLAGCSDAPTQPAAQPPQRAQTAKNPVRVQPRPITTPKPQELAMRELSISMVYAGGEVGTWPLQTLALNKGVIAPTDLEGFADAQGGLRLYRDRIYCFLDVDAAGDLLSYAQFLLGSLAALTRSSELSELVPPETFMGLKGVRGSLLHMDGSMLVLREQAGGALVLDYLDPVGQAPATRLSPYFKGVPIARSAWIAAAAGALDAYFAVVTRVLDSTRREAPRLAELKELWLRARGSLRT